MQSDLRRAAFSKPARELLAVAVAGLLGLAAVLLLAPAVTLRWVLASLGVGVTLVAVVVGVCLAQGMGSKLTDRVRDVLRPVGGVQSRGSAQPILAGGKPTPDGSKSVPVRAMAASFGAASGSDTDGVCGAGHGTISEEDLRRWEELAERASSWTIDGFADGDVMDLAVFDGLASDPESIVAQSIGSREDAEAIALLVTALPTLLDFARIHGAVGHPSEGRTSAE